MNMKDLSCKIHKGHLETDCIKLKIHTKAYCVHYCMLYELYRHTHSYLNCIKMKLVNKSNYDRPKHQLSYVVLNSKHELFTMVMSCKTMLFLKRSTVLLGFFVANLLC